MKKARQPIPRVNRRKTAENPSCQQTECKQNVIAAYISSAFHRHPIFFGVVCGFILRLLLPRPLIFK